MKLHVRMASSILIGAFFCYVVQCFTLLKNTSVKCTRKINTHKTTFGSIAPCYFGFCAQLWYEALEHHKHWFCLDDWIIIVGGSLKKYVVACPHVSIVWPIQHGVNLTQKEVSSLEEDGFMFDYEHKKDS